MGDFDDILGPESEDNEKSEEKEEGPTKSSFRKIWEAYERSKANWDNVNNKPKSKREDDGIYNRDYDDLKELIDEPENTGC
jgi:hypothetical protein